MLVAFVLVGVFYGKNTQPSADEPAKKELEKQKLIKTFAAGFVTIFGFLLSTGLFRKNKNAQPD